MAVAKIFTPELIANGRRRYENTDEPVASIAADFGVDRRTLDKYRLKWGWTPRSERPPVGLSPLDGLCEEAKDIPPPPVISAGPAPPAEATPAQDVPEPPAAPPAPAAAAADDPLAQRRTAMIERMWRAIDAELGAVERLREQLGAQPQRPIDAEKTSRTLESLTRTFREVDRLRNADLRSAANDDEYDDLPRDLEEFRRVLAERIDAFVASRIDGGGPEASQDADGGQAR